MARCCCPAPSSVTFGDSFPRPGEAIIRKIDFRDQVALLSGAEEFTAT